MDAAKIAAIKKIVQNQPDPESVRRGFADILGARLGVDCSVGSLKIEAGSVTTTFTMNLRDFMNNAPD
jgi:hypothetical protein